MTLAARAWAAIAGLTVAMGAVLFVTAGTVRYWQGWVYLLVYAGGAIVSTLYILGRDPALLERRMRGGPTAEKRPAQKVIMFFTSLCFIALLVVPALDFRFGWSRALPPAVVLAGDALIAIGFSLILIVYRANTFAAATVQIAKDQRVISTGPYAVVRHPMYASATLYLVGTPLALGSSWGFVPLGVMMPFLIWRIFDEERLLAEQLPGYREYQQRVRHRLLPGIW